MILLVTVLGIVQGVGYRPFVARLANETGITGTVQNNGGVVHIQAQGDEEQLKIFISALSASCPPGAQVTQVLTEISSGEQIFTHFRIIKSRISTQHTPILPTDLPMCPKCREELLDPGNRRFGYSFISCVDCGPRYSIMESIPYDRDTITMKSFPMCSACRKEYEGDDRRRHAQTISCHDCGPQLLLKISAAGASYEKKEALSRALEILRSGGVLAVKGIGGYQLACRPDLPDAVDALRKLKNRDSKPFAVMFPNLESIRTLCSISDQEERLLLSTARPIVLLTQPSRTPELSRTPVFSQTPTCPDTFPHNPFCREVNGESRFLGAFLPYTALHQQLTAACGPLIMTSANLSDEPILYKDEEISEVDSPFLSGVLYNTRRIVTPLDDSVARVAAGKEQVIRRSRSYVPLPLILKEKTAHTILSMGGDLKSSFCLYQNNRAYISQYFGDMDSYWVQTNFRENVIRMKQLFHMEPDIIACDLHPHYHTAALAEKWSSHPEGSSVKQEDPDNKDLQRQLPRRILIQHHHAHMASVMAEHGLDSCIGVAFDGTGYGTDGAVWGGEFLSLKGASYTREAHLAYVDLCGGDQAAKQADMTAGCFLAAAGEEIIHKDAAVIRAALRDGRFFKKTSSMGRLFDAVSSVLGICHTNTYEGECAVLLEKAAAEAVKDDVMPYPLHFPLAHGNDGSTADSVSVLRAVHLAVRSGTDKKALALGFHMAIVELVTTLCRHIRGKTGETRVALSGGVFANLLLVERCVEALEIDGFAVYINETVPTNDGGICLGQAWICSQMQK